MSSLSINHVCLAGHLTRDPVLRKTNGGTAVADLGLAINDDYTGKDGKIVPQTCFADIVVWGKSVENFVQPYLHKGDLIYVEGKLQTRSWEDKEGNKKYTTEINVTDIKGIQTGNAEAKPAAASNQQKTRPATQQQSRATAPAGSAIADEDIPF